MDLTLPIEVISKMDMGSSDTPSHSCKISMLWNWYTIDTCFIANTWHVRSRGGFAGSCIGVFFLVMASQWLHRICREYDQAIVAAATSARAASLTDSDASDEKVSTYAKTSTGFNTEPALYAVSHRWLWNSTNPNSCGDVIRPSLVQHVIRSVLFTIEWGLSYIIMLLFMYYNGYLIISCILGALFGRLFFAYEPLSYCDPISDSQNDDRKCCR